MSRIKKRDELTSNRFAMIKVANREENSSVSIHWHNEFEIIHLLEGQIYVINDSDLEKISLSQGDSLFIPPGCAHDIGDNLQKASALIIQFRIPDAIRAKHGGEKSFHLMFRDHYSIRLIRKGDRFSSQVAFLCNELYRNEQAPEPFSENLIQGAVQMLLSYFNDSIPVLPSISQGSQNGGFDLEKICAFIDEIGIPNATADGVAEHVGYTKKYFCLKFKRVVGKSFKSFLDQLKMQEARRLLGEGKHATEVAKLLGYSCVQNFSRTFKRIHKVSITEMLNIHK